MPIGRVGELWFFGAATPDQVKWVLIGDMLREKRYVLHFRHPVA